VAAWYANLVLHEPAVDTADLAPDRGTDEGRDADTALGRVASVAGLIAALAAVVAGATIWLLLTDPVTVANAVDEGEISPLVRQLAQVLYRAVAGLLDFL
jgi:hypothetical protein